MKLVWVCIVISVKALLLSGLVPSEGSHYAILSITQEPTDLKFLNTMQGSLTCQSDGQPAGKITWLTESGLPVTTIPNIRSVQDNQLIFHHFLATQHDQSVHSAKYRCKVASLAGEIVSRLATVRAELNIRYSPVVYHQSVPRSSPAIFKCHRPMGGLIQTFGWYVIPPHGSKYLLVVGGRLNGIKILSSGELIIPKVEQQHKGYKFACVSRNVLSNATLTSSPAMLFINDKPFDFPPTNIIKPLDKIITINDDLTLNCYASSYPPPSFKWYKDGHELLKSGRVSISHGTLTISNTIEDDNGRYTCIINNNRRYRIETVITIRVPLKFIERPKFIHSQRTTNTQQAPTFICKASGTSPMTVTWYRNGKLLIADGKRITVTHDSLTISNLEEKDEGMYQCFVSNKYESIQAEAQLVVKSTLPVVSIIHDNPPSKTVKSGDNVDITCHVTGSPQPQVKWLHDGVDIPAKWNAVIKRPSTRSSNLLISNIQTTMSGAFTCVAENTVGVASRSIDIVINDKPVIVNFPAKRNGVVGKPLYINCVAKGYPTSTVTWKRWSNIIATDASRRVFPNGTLLVISFSRSDQGEYECVAKNVNGQTVKRINVAVLEPPVIGPINVEAVIAGSRSFFTCTCTRGSSEELTITWLKDGIPATNVPGIQKERGNRYTANLFIEKVQPKHRGRYTCIARNRAGEMIRYTDFMVYETAVFKVEPRDATVIFGLPVLFPCVATGFPSPQIVWLRKSSPEASFTPVRLDHRVKQLENGTLVISVTQAHDDGEYICKAIFDTEQPFIPELSSKQIKLQVKVPARVIYTSTPIAYQEKGRSVRLVCSIIGTPSLNVKWFKNGGIIQNSDKYEITKTKSVGEKPSMLNSTMIVKSISTRDNTTYECMGINLYGSQKKHFYIVVQEKPSKPYGIRKLSATSKSIQFSWTPGYDGNLQIKEYLLEVKEKALSWNQGSSYKVLKGRSVTIMGLRPGATYTCRVKAKNKLGYSEFSGVESLSTEEEAPSAPPQNFSIKAIAKDQLLLIWQHPPRLSRNGRIIKYRIFYTPTSMLTSIQKKNVTIPSHTTYTLTNLLQFTGYKVQLQAATSAGNGPLSATVYATTLEGVPSAAPGNVNAHAVSSHEIVVSWEAIAQNSYNGVLQGYILDFTDVERSRADSVAVTSLEAPLSNLRVFARYQIRVSAYTNAGKGEASEVQEVVTFEDVPGEPSNFKAIPSNSEEIVLTWNPPINQNGIILNYIIYYKVLSDDFERKRIVRADLRLFRIRKLKVKEKYVFWMTAVTSKGEGNSTQAVTAMTDEFVPAKIITPKNFVVRKPIGSDVSLPCMAVGFPKPRIMWQSNYVGYVAKSRRWMAEDKPKLLYQITQEADGEYNCTATNSYGSDWNVVTLIVQVPPLPAVDISASLSERNGLYTIRITWVPGDNGNSPITKHHVSYAIKDISSDWLKRTIPTAQHSFSIENVTFYDVVYFKIASENAIGVGEYTEPVKLVISPHSAQNIRSVVRIYAAPTVFQKMATKEEESVSSNTFKKYFKPVLISAVAFFTLLMILLLIASWDREERRITEPRCSRLLCSCSCRSRKDFVQDPYGDPGLFWPWDIKRNRYSGTFDMKDELIPSSAEDQVEIKYLDGAALNYNAIQTSSNESMKKKLNDFEPVILFTSGSRTPDSQGYVPGKKTNVNKRTSPHEFDYRAPETWEGRPGSNRYSSTPSIIEKYFQSQELYNENGYSNRYVEDELYPDSVRNSVLSEESLDYAKPVENNYSKANGISEHDLVRNPPAYRNLSREDELDPQKPSPPNYEDIIPGYSDLSDAPRALFRKDGESARRGKIRHRKSLDSLLLKTLEDIEEQEVLTNTSTVNTPGLERHAAIVRDALQRGTRSYDSVSSTCSSSVGELRRAFEFGKKYGLQNYDMPPYLQDSLDDVTMDESNDEIDYLEHDKLLNMLNLANFSEIPKSVNDIEVKIPLPVRLNDSDGENDEENLLDSEYGKRGIPALSLV